MANINNLPATGISGADFVAVKIGDVNNDARTNALLGVEGRSFAGTFALNAEEAEVKAGGEYTVAFTAADIASVEGYQATLDVRQQRAGIGRHRWRRSYRRELLLAYVNEGLITTSWNGEGVNETGSAVQLVFRAKADAQLSELLARAPRITKAEAYKTNGSYQDVAFTFRQSFCRSQLRAVPEHAEPVQGRNADRLQPAG